MYSDKIKCKYFHIVKNLKLESTNKFTQQELANYIGVSKRTIVDFFNCKIVRFDLLEQVLAINGYTFDFETNLEIKYL